MRSHLFTVIVAAGLVAGSGTPSSAASSRATDDAARSDEACRAACCQHQEPDAVAILWAMDQDRATARPAQPVRQALVTWFHRPVRVGDRILLGKYIIEHDNARMARGEPCTHIYAADDPRLPVVAFHCTHLDRPVAERASVIVRPFGDGIGLSALREFQFAGELGAHGVPNVR